MDAQLRDAFQLKSGTHKKPLMSLDLPFGLHKGPLLIQLSSDPVSTAAKLTSTDKCLLVVYRLSQASKTVTHGADVKSGKTPIQIRGQAGGVESQWVGGKYPLAFLNTEMKLLQVFFSL